MLPALRFNPAAGPVNRLDSVFDHFFGDDGGFAGQAAPWTPVAVWEDDDHVFVEADLPGVSDGDVELTVHNGTLSIRGERRPEEGRNYLYNGRTYGRFERIIPLPEAVDAGNAEATLANGVLFLSLPKSPEARPRKIALKTQ